MNINPKVIDIYRLDSVGVSGFKNARDAGIRGVIHKASEGLAQLAREQPAYRERRSGGADPAGLSAH